MKFVCDNCGEVGPESVEFNEPQNVIEAYSIQVVGDSEGEYLEVAHRDTYPNSDGDSPYFDHTPGCGLRVKVFHDNGEEFDTGGVEYN
jgi:hypothetical protein